MKASFAHPVSLSQWFAREPDCTVSSMLSCAPGRRVENRESPRPGRGFTRGPPPTRQKLQKEREGFFAARTRCQKKPTRKQTTPSSPPPPRPPPHTRFVGHKETSPAWRVVEAYRALEALFEGKWGGTLTEGVGKRLVLICGASKEMKMDWWLFTVSSRKLSEAPSPK